MTLTHTPLCKFGEKAPNFCLLGTDGRYWSLQDCLGPNGLLVMFICNHCPYVKAINHKLVRDATELKSRGIGSVAIMPNDVAQYPEDSLENMRRVAQQLAYPFPYLIDETQEVARAFGAVCTPDLFGYNANLELQYRGRMDESRPGRDTPGSSQGLIPGHETGCGNRFRAARPNSLHGLFNQMAGCLMGAPDSTHVYFVACCNLAETNNASGCGYGRLQKYSNSSLALYEVYRRKSVIVPGERF